MKLKSLSLLTIAVLLISLFSCKQDPPIYPDDPDFVPYAGSSGGVSGEGATGTVDETQLSGNWKVAKMASEFYLNGVMQTSVDAVINLYSGVQLNNTGNAYNFDGGSFSPSNGAFTTSKDGTSLYIQLQVDPFSRSTNNKIQITNLTATSMTWIALDPVLTSNTAAGKLTGGWKVVYTRVK